MISHKLFRPLTLLVLLIFILILILLGQAWGKKDHAEQRETKMLEQTVYSIPAPQEEKVESYLTPPSLDLDLLQRDLVLQYLGISFAELRNMLGEPEDQGYSSWYGPHNYMTYNLEKGSVRFCSPLDLEDKLAVSIFVGAGQEVLGAKVGMTFTEIQDVLGSPAFGPEIGMGNLYYMEYFFGETNDQLPIVFISFSAESMNSPTHDAFIKWEAFEYEIGELM